MEEWQEIAQSIILGLLFSYLVAKLISIVVHFKDDHLRLTRAGDPTEDPPETEISGKDDTLDPPETLLEEDEEEEEDEEWEGVESTELDETFSAATAFVAATAADGRGRVGTEVQLQLYGLYKIATEGPCTAPQPSPLKITARAKWNAWQKLGAMPTEEAMEKYITIVTELYPTWAVGSLSRNQGEGDQASTSSARGTMGPVFSSFVDAEGPEIELKLDAIHVSAREGHADELIKLLDDGVNVNVLDGEGRTALHWAVDRGHLTIVELLIHKEADMNVKDNEGQTPLHYAALCDRREIAELLVKHGAAIDVKDDDGNSPRDLCGSSWDFMKPAN